VSHDSLVVGPDGLVRPAWANSDLLRHYYDTEWGMPVRDERGIFERISLEVFQAGLSWATILSKREAFREAFANFDPEVVASYGPDRISQLKDNPGIVRNGAKITATINNARATVALREGQGISSLVWSFKPVTTPEPHNITDIPSSTPESTALANALRSHGFTFVGPTSMFALMEAIGMVDTHLVGSHRRGSSGIWPLPTPSQALT
jgi:DNA-3-methyladenine glycosylase I